jgi:hypothetical protein
MIINNCNDDDGAKMHGNVNTLIL